MTPLTLKTFLLSVRLHLLSTCFLVDPITSKSTCSPMLKMHHIHVCPEGTEGSLPAQYANKHVSQQLDDPSNSIYISVI